MPVQPVAVIVAATRSQIRHFGPAIERAGYTISFLNRPDQVPTSHTTPAANLLVYNQNVGHTAILSGYRALSQRPDLVILIDDHALPGEGFQPQARVPHTPDDLELLLRHHLTPPIPMEAPEPTQPEPQPAQMEPEPPQPAQPEPQPAQMEPEPAQPEPEPPQMEPQPPQPAQPEPQPYHQTSIPSGSTPEGVSHVTKPARVATIPGEHSRLRTPPVSPQAETPERQGRGRRMVIGILFVLLIATAATIVLNQFPRRMGGDQPDATLTAIEVTTSDGAAAYAATPPPTSHETTTSTISMLTTTPTMDTSVQPTPIRQPTTTRSNTSDIDLVAEVIGVVPSQPEANDAINVQVRIHNTGSHPITSTFWVDLYVAPQQTPAVNQLWTDISPYGATWLIEGLEANETRVLESLGADPARSNLLYFPDNDAVEVYALVDSYGFDGKGAIQERDEENNLSLPFEIPISTGSAGE